MVKKVRRKGQTVYLCEECGFAYEEEEWAEKCQAWDKEHQTCNLEIIQHSVHLNK